MWLCALCDSQDYDDGDSDEANDDAADGGDVGGDDGDSASKHQHNDDSDDLWKTIGLQHLARDCSALFSLSVFVLCAMTSGDINFVCVECSLDAKLQCTSRLKKVILDRAGVCPKWFDVLQALNYSQLAKIYSNPYWRVQ